MINDGANVTWSLQPAAVTEFNGSTRWRTKFDLTNFSSGRITVNVATAGFAGPPPAKIRAEFSTDQTSWQSLDTGSNGDTVNIDTTGLKVSSWGNLASSAKADVYLRIVGLDGNGLTSPAFGRIDIQVK